MDLKALLDKPKEDTSTLNVNNEVVDFTAIISRLETLEKQMSLLNKKADEDIDIDEDNNENVSTPQNAANEEKGEEENA